MKTLAKITVVILVLGGGGVAAFAGLRAWWQARNRPVYRQVEVTRGDLVSVVNSTGTVEPVDRVPVGSFVSGPIEKLFAFHNQRVKKGEVLAQIDPSIYKAAVARDRATLLAREAEVDRLKPLLEQATNEERRANDLLEEDVDFISEAELDQVRCNRESLAAQLKAARAAVDQAQANLDNSTANVGYTKIIAPRDGMVIDRKIDEGQTVAAQFQTPELFVVVPDLEGEMDVHASVDEADIGLIREAQRTKRPVYFTVDAYPDDLFEGTIHEVRYNPTTTQNVVTYPVIVRVPANPGMKLLPGMTANLSFEIDKHEDVLKIPNAALRFYPKREQVRPEDHPLLDGTAEEPNGEEEDAAADSRRSAAEIVRANRRRNHRHVWVVDKEHLRAVPIVTGLGDHKYTELVSGEIEEGQKLVTGVETAGFMGR